MFMYVLHIFVVHSEAGRGRQIPLELELIGGSELPCGYWEQNLGSLQEQLIFLTTGPSGQVIIS